jgi:aspartyl/asparaginyl beta-hydroxylase (cupin superfamily)
MKPFIQISDQWKTDLEHQTDAIKKEIRDALSDGKFEDQGLWKSSYSELVLSSRDNHWKTSVFKFFGINRLDVHKAFPITAAALQIIPNLVTAEISFLYPNVKIKSHKGYSKMVLRNHLPLIVPAGDTGLKVLNITHRWKEGELVSFNDSLEHEAWNSTDEIRVVLMFDIAQPNGEYTAYEICKYHLQRLKDPTILQYGTSKDWLGWLADGHFPIS